ERIVNYLASFESVPNFSVLNNAVNIGFAGTVNRALQLTKGGDVVLLNADTIVPPKFIERLAAYVQADSTIGTITPLSNNGEFTSFPLANRASQLPQAKELAEIDRIAAFVNGGKAIDIPNGIGFCLYITR